MKASAVIARSPKSPNEARRIVHHLKNDGRFPNNAKLPLVIYENAFELPEQDGASAVEDLLAQNHWNGSWRNGIYPYHHYHSTAHEVLVVYRGSAKVQLGGEQGVVVNVNPADVLIIPAGAAHKNLGSSDDFAVVGAYPEGQNWDIKYGDPDERPRADQNIAKVALPKADPIYGQGGPLDSLWEA